jgi:hypothetical protein
MVFSVHLQRSAVAAIVNYPVQGQFIGSRSLKQAVPQPIWLFQESLSGSAKRVCLITSDGVSVVPVGYQATMPNEQG